MTKASQVKWFVWLSIFLGAGAALLAVDELYFTLVRGSHPIVWPPDSSKFLACLIVGGIGLIFSSSQLGLRLAGGSIVGRYIFALLIIAHVVNGHVMRAKRAYEIMLAFDALTTLGFALAIYSMFQRTGNRQDNSKDIGVGA